MTGEWGGARAWLIEHGIDIGIFYTGDVIGPAAGGLEQKAVVLGSIDLIIDLDLERLLGIPGGAIALHGLNLHGGFPSSLVGDLQALDNIDAPNQWRLYQAYYSQMLFKDRLQLLVGILDTNSEFDVIPAGAVFLHSSFGMGAELGNSGANGPSTFPFTSLTGYVEARPLEFIVARFALANGIPPGESRFRRPAFRDSAGVFMIGEVALLNLPAPSTDVVRRRFGTIPDPEERHYGRYGKYAVGAWGYTTDFESGMSESDRGTVGVYALVEQAVFRETGRPFEGLGIFARGGFAQKTGNVIDTYLGGGLAYAGLVSNVTADRAGIGVAAARPVDGPPWEVAVEATYRFPVTPWLYLQPDVQLVVEPANVPTAETALVGALRMLITL